MTYSALDASDICTGVINEWEDCPTNPKVYEGCSHVVSEFFHSVSHSCHNDFEYTTEVNKKNIDPMVTLVNGSIYCCNISVEFVVLQVDHIVMFTAKELVNLSANPIMIDCNDTLDIYSEFMILVMILEALQIVTHVTLLDTNLGSCISYNLYLGKIYKKL